MSNLGIERGEEFDRGRIEIPTRYSVAVLVEQEYQGVPFLLLVRQSVSKLWSPPAGGIKELVPGIPEEPLQAMDREMLEESGLKIGEDYWEDIPVRIGSIDITPGKYSRMGYIFRGKIHNNVFLPSVQLQEGMDRTTDLCHFANKPQVYSLIKKGLIYRPEINIPLLNWWINFSQTGKQELFIELAKGGDK